MIFQYLQNSIVGEKQTKPTFPFAIELNAIIFVPSARRAEGTMLSCIRVCP